METSTPFIHDDFLLQSKTAQRLYHEVAKDLPLIDFHNHLPPQAISDNHQFEQLTEIWLDGDHYKWRAMRIHGVEEKYCTGDATPHEKFLAWVDTLPYTVRNPLYHWSHLELKRFFGLDCLINKKSAEIIWKTANEKLKNEELSVQGILKNFRLEALCTTDDPADDLVHHRKIKDSDLAVRVTPTYRPDNAFNLLTQPAEFKAWLSRLESVSNVSITTFDNLLEALDKRHLAFHEVGCRLSDHGVEKCFADFCSKEEAARIFDDALAGKEIDSDSVNRYCSYLMLFFGQLDSKRGWTKQLHMGAMRNNSTRLSQKLGKDIGVDSIGDFPQAQALSRYLDELDKNDTLPKVILYNNNPNDNYILGTMVGNFCDGSMAGKIQLGAPWWHLDQKEGIEWHLNTASNTGLLSHFVGMITDSRSFMSFTRHEYFRRVFCNVIGSDVESGQIPNDNELLEMLVKNVCYENAKNFFA